MEPLFPRSWHLFFLCVCGGCFAYVSKSRGRAKDTLKETGDPTRLHAQLTGGWGQMTWSSERLGKKCFVLGRLDQPMQDKSLLYRHVEPNEPTTEGPLSFVLVESPSASVSTVSRGPPHSSLSGSSSHPTQGKSRFLVIYPCSKVLSYVQK